MKYGNIKVNTPDGVFDSKLEYNRFMQLKWLEKAGLIKDLQKQVKFILVYKSEHGREISYVADFTYYKGDKYIVEDTKCQVTRTRLYSLKKRLMAERYGIKITEITRENCWNGNY